MTLGKGIFIALEGIDGSGKSTQIIRIAEALRKKGFDVFITSEPSSGKLGPILRDYLSNPKSHFAVDALLFAADRVEHYFSEIQPALNEGNVVITDRYKTSSIIYQGSTHLSDEWITLINSQVPDPDITLYLKLSAEVAMSRLSDADRSHLEKFETEEKLQHILQRYETIEIPNRVDVDAELPLDELTAKIVTLIENRL